MVQRVRGIVHIRERQFTFHHVAHIIDPRLDHIVHILLPVAFVGRIILPVIGIVRVAIGVGRPRGIERLCNDLQGAGPDERQEQVAHGPPKLCPAGTIAHVPCAVPIFRCVAGARG